MVQDYFFAIQMKRHVCLRLQNYIMKFHPSTCMGVWTWSELCIEKISVGFFQFSLVHNHIEAFTPKNLTIADESSEKCFVLYFHLWCITNLFFAHIVGFKKNRVWPCLNCHPTTHFAVVPGNLTGTVIELISGP